MQLNAAQLHLNEGLVNRSHAVMTVDKSTKSSGRSADVEITNRQFSRSFGQVYRE